MRMGILHDTSCANPLAANCTYNLGPGSTTDPRGIGLNSYSQELWNKYMPAGNAGTVNPCGALTSRDNFCDGFNTLAFTKNMAIPQNDNFAVVRLDHDFGQKWHFMSSYRVYHLKRATDDQIDIGGFFSGDTLGTPSFPHQPPASALVSCHWVDYEHQFEPNQ